MSGADVERANARFLALLNQDPDVAEALYAQLSRRLVRFFEWRGCRHSHDLAQETLRRGFSRLATGVDVYASDPGHYFLGIARNVLLESWKDRVPQQAEEEWIESQPASAAGPDRIVESAVLLEQYLSDLAPSDRELLVRYHLGERRELASELGLDPNALRVRVHRLTKRVREAALAAGRTK